MRQFEHDRDRIGTTRIFILACFAIAWLPWGMCWILARRGSSADVLTPIVIAGSFGPFLAAGISEAWNGGLAAVTKFYLRVFQWRMGWWVFIFSLFLVPVLAIATAACFDHGWPSFGPSLSQIPMMYLWLLILGGPLGEELGWSYMSDRLDRHLSVVTETCIVALVWAVWHLPLFILDIPGLSQKYVPFFVFVAMSLAMRALFSWAYHRGGRSIPSNILMHNGLNVGLSLVTIVSPQLGTLQPRLLVLSALTATVALLLWWMWPPDHGMTVQLKASVDQH